jgi:uncharacterized protein (TIGR02246 family)
LVKFLKSKSLIMKKATCTCVFLIATLTQAAQNTGTVEYKEFGMAFTIETFDGFFKNDATAQEWQEPLHLPHNATITSAGQESAVGEIHATWDAFIAVWETEDAAACAGFYTATGINIPPGAEIHEGREAIASFYSGLFKANASSRYRHETLSLEICGDTAVERGEFDVNWVRNDGSAWTFRARCMVHWERQPDGTWRKKLFLYNTPPLKKAD